MKLTLNDLELVQYMWYTSRTCVGIVLCKDTITEEYKAYIGAAKGDNEKYDVSQIMSWGATFPVDIAKTLMRIN